MLPGKIATLLVIATVLSVIGEITALRHARLAEEPRKATPKRETA